LKANKSNFYGYNKNLKGLAKANRVAMTKAEACLWKYVLRARQMKGYQFRRQGPVLNFIADFMCKELKLIIEVDGSTHHYSDTQFYDQTRQRELEDAGFTILRFADEEVLEAINEVMSRIEDWIEKRNVTPPPSPPPAGDTKDF
jgi:very-short-patch-repair endonuclease